MNSKPKHGPASAQRIVFLLGKPVRAKSLFPDLFAHLQASGQKVHIHLPHETGEVTFPWARSTDLFLHRGLFPGVLAALQQLEQAGLLFCNSITATIGVNNRIDLHKRLQLGGFPIPFWQTAENWQEVLALPPEKNMMVKTMNGFIGRGVGVASLDRKQRPVQPPFAGPYLVEELIANDGWDHKLYVVGKECRGLLKKWPRNACQPSLPFIPDTALADLAIRTGQALGLEIYGVDFVISPSGPVIVDVNVFPGFKGVADAPRLIADYITGHLVHLRTARKEQM